MKEPLWWITRLSQSTKWKDECHFPKYLKGFCLNQLIQESVWKKNSKQNNCSVGIREFYTVWKSLPSDVEGFIGLVEIAFPTVQIKYCRMIFCMSKHPPNNEQTNNVLKRKTESTFCFFYSCVDYSCIQDLRVSCWLSIKCSLASSCCYGDGFCPLNAEPTGKEKKYTRYTRRAGEYSVHSITIYIIWANATFLNS